MEKSIVHFQQVLNNLGGDVDLLNETVSISLKYLPQHLEKVRVAVEAKRGRDLELAAHTLKGSLSIYLHQGIVQTAFKLEQLGKSNDFTEANALFFDLERQMNSLLSELKLFSKAE